MLYRLYRKGLVAEENREFYMTSAGSKILMVDQRKLE